MLEDPASLQHRLASFGIWVRSQLALPSTSYSSNFMACLRVYRSSNLIAKICQMLGNSMLGFPWRQGLYFFITEINKSPVANLPNQFLSAG